jgi:hypothetical protein
MISFLLGSCAKPPLPTQPPGSPPPPKASPPAASKVEPLTGEKPVKHSFSRSYPVDFMSFYPKLHSALQDYANRNKGNSFQVVRLGSDAVIIRGLYKGERDQDHFLAVITAKPEGPKKSLLEIKLSPIHPVSSASLETAAEDLFQMVGKGMDLTP